MSIETPCERTYGVQVTSRPAERAGPSRPGRWCLLIATAVCCLWPLWLSADGPPAPVDRRFEVHRTADGFVLLGFRASVGSADRFTLMAGMSADQARGQMLSVGWGWSLGLQDPKSLEMAANRVRFRDVSETVTVVLDPTGQLVQTIAYEWQPALFSRDGLLRYLLRRHRLGGRAGRSAGPRPGSLRSGRRAGAAGGGDPGERARHQLADRLPDGRGRHDAFVFRRTASRCTIRTVISAGVMPLIRRAWPRLTGWCAASFSRASMRRCGTAA